MAFTRRQLGEDATYQRAWTCDAPADLTALALVLGPGGPARGDLAFVTSISQWYIWTDTAWLIVSTNLLYATGILPTTQGGSGVDLSAITTGRVLTGVTGAPGTFTSVAAGAVNTVLQGGGASQPAFTATPTINTITFPAVQVPTGAVNTLDDYEEGSWTPTLTFGNLAVGITYVFSGGTYIKIGLLVFATARLVLSSKGSSTGAARIASLPFTTGNVFCPGTGAVGAAGTMSALTSAISIIGEQAVTTATLLQFNAAGSASVTDANFTNNSDLFFSLTYQASQ